MERSGVAIKGMFLSTHSTRTTQCGCVSNQSGLLTLTAILDRSCLTLIVPEPALHAENALLTGEHVITVVPSRGKSFCRNEKCPTFFFQETNQ